MTTAAIYVRVSTEDQASEGTSLDVQQERCRAYCVAQGWEVQRVYVDAGVSGALASRPALDELLGAVRAGMVEVVLVAKLDRLGRSAGHLSPLLEELDERDVAFVSLAEQWDTSTAAGRFVRGMFAQLAQLERDTIRDRTSSGRRARVAAGGWGGGDCAPYGYQVVGNGKDAHLEVDEGEAAMLNRAASLLLDQAMTTTEVARALNAEGFLPRKAPRWSQTNLRNVLKRTQLGGTWTYGKTGKEGAASIAVPPVMDPERFMLLQARVRATSMDSHRVGRAYPLTGRLFGTCGHHFHGIGRADRRVIRYRCTYGRDLPHHDRCPEPSVRADELEPAVWSAVCRLLSDPDWLVTAAGDWLGTLQGAANAEHDALVRAQLQVDQLQRALADAVGTGLKAGLDADTMRAVTDQLQEELAQARHHLQLVATMRADTDARSTRLQQVQQVALVAQERLQDANLATQLRVLALLDVRVTVVSHGRPGSRSGPGGPVQLRIEGAVAHDVLLLSAERDWHPLVGATARA